MIPFAYFRAPCYPLAASWTPEWNSLVDYWPLDGSGAIANNATIPATVGVTGTATNTGMSFVTGKIGQGISFNGSSDYISMGTLVPLQSAAQFSIAAWIDVSSYAVRQTIIGEETLVKIQVQTTGNILAYVSSDGSSWAVTITSSGTIATNKWVHVVVTYNGSQVVLYMNGVNQGSAALTGSLGSNGNPFQISGFQGNNELFAGSVDDVAVWTKGLTAAEVTRLYTNQICTGP